MVTSARSKLHTACQRFVAVGGKNAGIAAGNAAELGLLALRGPNGAVHAGDFRRVGAWRVICNAEKAESAKEIKELRDFNNKHHLLRVHITEDLLAH